jgi:hypothetical protein
MGLDQFWFIIFAPRLQAYLIQHVWNANPAPLATTAALPEPFRVLMGHILVALTGPLQTAVLRVQQDLTKICQRKLRVCNVQKGHMQLE